MASTIQPHSQQSIDPEYDEIINAVLSHNDSGSQQRPGPSGLQQGGQRPYTITPLKPKEIPKWKTRGLGFSVNLHREIDRADFYELVEDTIGSAFRETQGGKVGLEIRHPVLQRPILIPFSDADKLTADKVTNTVDVILQSKFFLFNGDLRLEYTIIGGRAN